VKDLNLFNYNGQNVRTVLIGSEPWFVAADVSRILGYRMASDMTRRLDSEDRGTRSVRTPSGDQEMIVISEPGLYLAVLGSQVDGAKAFKRWITREVLPAIRKTGTYSAAPSLPQSYSEALRLENGLRHRGGHVRSRNPLGQGRGCRIQAMDHG
jgi:prophage antirepressor-like protein